MFSLYSDGGSRGNPGISGAGFVIYDANNNKVNFGKKTLGITTNNVAEHFGLQIGLESAKNLNIKNIKCYLDSELVVKQCKGEYKIKNQNLKNIFTKTSELIKFFDTIEFIHIPREKNKEADKLANIAMDNNE